MTVYRHQGERSEPHHLPTPSEARPVSSSKLEGAASLLVISKKMKNTPSRFLEPDYFVYEILQNLFALLSFQKTRDCRIKKGCFLDIILLSRDVGWFETQPYREVKWNLIAYTPMLALSYSSCDSCAKKLSRKLVIDSCVVEQVQTNSQQSELWTENFMFTKLFNSKFIDAVLRQKHTNFCF